MSKPYQVVSEGKRLAQLELIAEAAKLVIEAWSRHAPSLHVYLEVLDEKLREAGL